MKNHRVDYSLAGMCQCFSVPRSGYYAWLQRKPSQRFQRRQLLDEQVKFLFHKHKQRYTHGHKWFREAAAENGDRKW